MKNVEFLENS